MREIQYKPTVEVGEAQEAAKIGHCLRGWPIAYDLDLVYIHMHTLVIYDISQIFYSLHVEGTLMQIGIYLVLSQCA
jgi:hypothetical protein